MKSATSETLSNRIKATIREIPDFPKKGILFKDITPILKDADLCTAIVDELYNTYKNDSLSAVLGIESRGFLFGPPLAMKLKIPFIPVRKKGKLPAAVISEKYELEYGEAILEMHQDALNAGDRVLIHDDLLATGGTVLAAKKLVEQLGASIDGYSFIINLSILSPQSPLLLSKTPINSIVTY